MVILIILMVYALGIAAAAAWWAWGAVWCIVAYVVGMVALCVIAWWIGDRRVIQKV